jgi:hypothetical protein
MTEQIGNRPDYGAFIPSELDDYGLDPFEFRVFCHISRRAGTSNGEFYEGDKNAAKRCCMELKTYRKAKHYLEQSGLITIEIRPGKTAIVHLVHCKDWPTATKLGATKSGTTTKSGATRSGATKSGTTTKSGATPLPDQAPLPLPNQVQPDQAHKGTPILKGSPNEVIPTEGSKEERERNARSQKKPVENSSGASDCADKPDPLTDGSIQKTKSAPTLAPNEFDERVWADAKNLDTEERQAFWLWLKARVIKMPTPPANPAQVARSFIRMDGDELLQQFRDETNAARLVAIPSQPIIPNPDTDHRLFRLQSEWRLADELARKTIASEIASKPEWGIAIGPHGPEKILVPLAKTDHGNLIGKMEAQLVHLQMTKRQAIAYMVEARLWDKTCDPGMLTDDQLQQLTDALTKFPRQTIANNLGANR